MINIISNGNKIAYGIKQYMVDFINEIDQLPKDISPGSSAFVVENSSIYVLDSFGKWAEKIENNRDGLSAYEVAVTNGFKGSEIEWLYSLKGEDYLLTEQDKVDIANIVLTLLPFGDEVGY